MPGQARATDAACPLCGDHDGISHMLGSCGHPMMKAMYIDRHNAATRKILRLMLEGSNGNCYMLADVGSTDKLGNIGPLDSRLPGWLVPTDILLQRGLDRDKLRPDILMINIIAMPLGFSSSRPTRASAPGAGTHQMGKHVCIVEVGYCAATRYHDKMNEKQQQHAQLISLLESLGYRVDILPVLLGNTGEIFHSTITNIKNTGADADRADKLASRLSLHAQHSMQSNTEPPSRGEVRPRTQTIPASLEGGTLTILDRC